MMAIVKIAGQQFKVEEGQEIFVHRLNAEEGEVIKLDEVLLVELDGKISVGTPNLKASINAKVLGHQKGDKVIVFKKKRRKGYHHKLWHIKKELVVQITDVILKVRG